jgi:ATP-dependent exoDNAse (exonuclease V) beta subunit
MQKMIPVLATKNAHPRDKHIKFYARGHKYEITTDPKSKYTSVTTWNHAQFPKFDADAVIANIFRSKSWGPGHKYWGQSAEQIKASWKANGDAVSGAGTSLHERIEHFMNDERFQFDYTNEELYDDYRYGSVNPSSECLEWQYFIHFIRDFPKLKPFRTEWMIFHEELKIAGSIDMVYENPDGTLSIYDWKRSKEITKVNNWNQFATNPLICHLHDTNFWHYALQLNTYKAILEDKYGVTVSSLHLVRLHPDTNEQTYELLDVPILTKEISDLFEERKSQIKTT